MLTVKKFLCGAYADGRSVSENCSKILLDGSTLPNFWIKNSRERISSEYFFLNFIKETRKFMVILSKKIRFWESVQELKALPQRQVRTRASEIWREYLAPDAPCPVNVDSSSRSTCKANVEAGADRWSFDHAQVPN